MTAGKPLSDYEQRLIDNVQHHGCQSLYVMADPPFGYSIGFIETVGQPEVIVYGLSSETTSFVVNETLRQCRAGLFLEEGVTVDGILAGLPMIARRVASQFIVKDNLNSAMWYHRRVFGRELDNVMQLVWPSDEGLWPWEDEFPDDLRLFQPALWTETLH